MARGAPILWRVRIDLNADLGEGVGDDEALLGIVTSASIATGAHAGGGPILEAAVSAAVAHGVSVGAHPSYRDREGFGRRSLLPALREDAGARAAFVTDLVDQVLVVAEQASARGGQLRHVKAHGALYNESVADPVAAGLVAEAVARAAAHCGHGIVVLTEAGGALAAAAERAGLTVRPEGFVDRAYLPSAGLVPRDQPGALLSDTSVMAAQALDLAAGRVRCTDGSWRAVRVQSLCVHGDTPDAVAAARAVRRALEAAGWVISAEPAP